MRNSLGTSGSPSDCSYINAILVKQELTCDTCGAVGLVWPIRAIFSTVTCDIYRRYHTLTIGTQVSWAICKTQQTRVMAVTDLRYVYYLFILLNYDSLKNKAFYNFRNVLSYTTCVCCMLFTFENGVPLMR